MVVEQRDGGISPSSIPQEVSFGIVAGTFRNEYVDPSGRRVQGVEIIEERIKESARSFQTEGRREWERKGFRPIRIIKRMWKGVLGEVATYAKEADFSARLYAESGIQMTSIPFDFLTQVRAEADREIKNKRGNILKKRAWGGLRDFVHELSFTEKELHKETIHMMEQLRRAVENPSDPNNQTFISQHQALYHRYEEVLKADFAQAEAIGRRASSIVADEIFSQHAGVGDKLARQYAVLQGPPADFIKTYVIQPILQTGLSGGDVDRAVMQARLNMQNFFFSKDFVDWLDKQSDDVKKSLKLSLSYGTDIVLFVTEQLLPQLLEAKLHGQSLLDLGSYLNEMTLKVRVGTAEAGQKGGMNEERIERLARRHITQEKVMKMYREIRASGDVQAVPDAYLQAADGRARWFGKYIATGATSHIALGVAAGFGLYGLKAGARTLGRMTVPIIGGSAVGGVVRAFEERRKFTREYEQHQLETELGYHFTDDMKRRMEMRNLEMPRRKMQEELTDRMTPLIDKLRLNRPLTDLELNQLIGLITDTDARIHLGDVRGNLPVGSGIGFLSSDNAQSYQVEKLNLEVASAEAKMWLKRYFDNNPNILDAFATTIGINTSGLVGTPDQKADIIFKELRETLEQHITDGSLSTYRPVLDAVCLQTGEDIISREKAFKKLRVKRMVVAGGTTFVAGMIGGLTFLGMNEGADMITQTGGVTIGTHTIGAAGLQRAFEGYNDFRLNLTTGVRELLTTGVRELKDVFRKIGWLKTEGPTSGPIQISEHVSINVPEGWRLSGIDHVKHSFDLTDPQGAHHTMLFTDADGQTPQITNASVLGEHVDVQPIQVGIDTDHIPVASAVKILAGVNVQNVNDINFKVPNGFLVREFTDPTGKAGVLIFENGHYHLFVWTTDATGNVTGLSPLDPNETLIPTNFLPKQEVAGALKDVLQAGTHTENIFNFNVTTPNGTQWINDSNNSSRMLLVLKDDHSRFIASATVNNGELSIQDMNSDFGSIQVSEIGATGSIKVLGENGNWSSTMTSHVQDWYYDNNTPGIYDRSELWDIDTNLYQGPNGTQIEVNFYLQRDAVQDVLRPQMLEVDKWLQEGKGVVTFYRPFHYQDPILIRAEEMRPGKWGVLLDRNNFDPKDTVTMIVNGNDVEIPRGDLSRMLVNQGNLDEAWDAARKLNPNFNGGKYGIDFHHHDGADNSVFNLGTEQVGDKIRRGYVGTGFVEKDNEGRLLYRQVGAFNQGGPTPSEIPGNPSYEVKLDFDVKRATKIVPGSVDFVMKEVLTTQTETPIMRFDLSTMQEVDMPIYLPFIAWRRLLEEPEKREEKQPPSQPTSPKTLTKSNKGTSVVENFERKKNAYQKAVDEILQKLRLTHSLSEDELKKIEEDLRGPSFDAIFKNYIIQQFSISSIEFDFPIVYEFAMNYLRGVSTKQEVKITDEEKAQLKEDISSSLISDRNDSEGKYAATIVELLVNSPSLYNMFKRSDPLRKQQIIVYIVIALRNYQLYIN